MVCLKKPSSNHSNASLLFLFSYSFILFCNFALRFVKKVSNRLKPYHLGFTGLSLGHHHFDFDIGSDFFECFEETEIHVGQVKVDLDLEKQEKMLVLSFDIHGEVEVVCDRCAYEYMQPISGKEVVFIKFGSEYLEEDDDVLILPQGSHEVDVSSMLYDFIHLLVPYHRLHLPDEQGNLGCNKENLEILEELSPKETPVDPRWDVLNQLKID